MGTELISGWESLTISTNALINQVTMIADVEKDNKRTIAYNVAGIKVKEEKVFVNKTKEMKLRFYGETNVLGVNLKFNKTIDVNTDIYNKYDWYVSNGILYVILFEKINTAPEFNRIEKTKKVKEEVNG